MPYQLIAGVILAALAFAAGWRVNEWRNDSADLKAQEVAERASVAATEAAVTAIKGIEIKYVTIKQQGETVTREVPVYRECMHDPRGMQLVNEALEGGRVSPADSAARVPGSDAVE